MKRENKKIKCSCKEDEACSDCPKCYFCKGVRHQELLDDKLTLCPNCKVKL